MKARALRAWAACVRVVHVFRRVRVLEFQMAGFLNRIAICEGCGMVIDSQNSKIKISQTAAGGVVPYCRWCFQQARDRSRADKVRGGWRVKEDV